MSRFLYEKSVSYRGNLIIPFIFSRVDSQDIYSYALISERGHKSLLHKAENPAGLYSNSMDDIIEISKRHLDKLADETSSIDYFKERYTYCHNLIIIHQETVKCFYDHYPPDELRNIAAPKLFDNASDCLNWIKQGLERHQVR